MQANKGSAMVILLIVLVIVLAAVLVYFAYFRKPGEVAISPTPTPTANPTATWKTYQNEKYGFEFKYPPYLKRVGSNSPNSVLGSVQNPIGGIYLGPAVLIVADTPELKKISGDYYNRYVDIANNPSPTIQGPSVQCEKIDISPIVSSVSCSGSGGRAIYALIKGSNLDIFVDVYSGGYTDSGLLEDFQNPEDFKTALSTFKFTK